LSKPLHVTAFEHFKSKNPNHLEAMIAFGIFIDGEQKWANEKNPPPTDAKYRQYHDTSLSQQHTEFCMDSARTILQNIANETIAAKKAEFLSEAIEQYKAEASKGHNSFHWWGLAEATIGAVSGSVIWTLSLIGITAIALRSGIDLLEIYKKMAGLN